MPRFAVLLVALLVVLLGGAALLAGRAKERPTAHVEKSVSLANLS